LKFKIVYLAMRKGLFPSDIKRNWTFYDEELSV